MCIRECMRRKLVKQGAATMMVSLPAKWIHEHNLRKGSEVLIEPQHGNLLVSTETVAPKTETSISLGAHNESAIRTLLTNTYRRGFDRILVSFRSEAQYQTIVDTVKTRLIGFEVMKREKTSCVVENITEPSFDHYENLFKKVMFNVSEMITIVLQHAQKITPSENYEDVEERIQKYDNFCRRVLINTKPKNYEFIWTFLTLIVHAQRELYHLVRALEKARRDPPSKEIVDFVRQCESLYELLKKAYMDKNIALAAEIHAVEKQLIYEKGYKLLSENKGTNVIIIHHCMASIRMFYLAASPLLGMMME